MPTDLIGKYCEIHFPLRRGKCAHGGSCLPFVSLFFVPLEGAALADSWVVAETGFIFLLLRKQSTCLWKSSSIVRLTMALAASSLSSSGIQQATVSSKSKGAESSRSLAPKVSEWSTHVLLQNGLSSQNGKFSRGVELTTSYNFLFPAFLQYTAHQDAEAHFFGKSGWVADLVWLVLNWGMASHYTYTHVPCRLRSYECDISQIQNPNIVQNVAFASVNSWRWRLSTYIPEYSV